MDTESEVQRAIQIGQANQKVIELSQNWCAHLSVDSMGGVGLVEEETGLPIGARRFRCQFASAGGFAGMDLETIALDFYDRNCSGCTYRKPVGLPNLSELVEKRDSDAIRREELGRLSAEREAEAIKTRSAKRSALHINDASNTTAILDILDRFDHAPNEENGRNLMETFAAAPDTFDNSVEEALFELAEAGGNIRTKVALSILDELTDDKNKLTETALGAIARDDAIRTAGSIIAEGRDVSHKDRIPAAVPSLVWLASRTPHDIFIPRSPADPEPLRTAYRIFPEVVYSGICDLLEQPNKHSRIQACDAAAALIEMDPDFGMKIASELMGTLELPDDHYDEGSAEAAVARTLGEALRARPSEIDSIIGKEIASAPTSKRVALFKAYTWVLRPLNSAEQKPADSPAQELAFSRIVAVLSDRPDDKRLSEAARFLRHDAQNYPDLLEDNIEMLLGAAALIASDLEEPYSPLLDSDPSPTKTFEVWGRQTQLNTVLRDIMGTVGWLAQRRPSTVCQVALQMLEGLGESHEILKAALVKSLGIAGQSRDGLAVVMPTLYSAAMDRSQLIRAAAAEAYGNLANRDAEDLPSLVHESFLVLLQDPYLIVHRQAIRSLGRVRLPDKFLDKALDGLTLLINSYSKSKADDEILSECIEQFIRLARRQGRIAISTIQAVIKIIDQMDPGVASGLIRDQGPSLRVDPSFSDLVVKLLKDPGTLDHDLEALIEYLGEIPAEDIRRLSDSISEASEVCLARGNDFTDEFIAVLTSVGAWSTAVVVARDRTDRFEDTEWDHARKLRAGARQAATELEFAAHEGDNAEIVACAVLWSDLEKEINIDDEENRESREPFRGLRIPNSRD